MNTAKKLINQPLCLPNIPLSLAQLALISRLHEPLELFYYPAHCSFIWKQGCAEIEFIGVVLVERGAGDYQHAFGPQ